MDFRVITVKFECGTLKSLDVALLEKYPTSPLLAHAISSFSDDVYEFPNMSLEVFLKIQKMMSGQIKESGLSTREWELANFYGLTSDSLYYVRMSRLKALEQELFRLENFLCGDVKIFSDSNTDLYDQTFKVHPQILKVQVLISNTNKLHGVFSKGIPLVYSHCGLISVTDENGIRNLKNAVNIERPIDVHRRRQDKIFDKGDLEPFWDSTVENWKKIHGISKVVKSFDHLKERSSFCDYLSSHLNDLVSVADFFSSDENTFLNEVGKFTTRYLPDNIKFYLQDHSFLYDQIFIEFPEHHINKIFEILSEHLHVLRDDNPLNSQYQYYPYDTDLASLDLSCLVMRHFYINIS